MSGGIKQNLIYQNNFLSTHREVMLDERIRIRKAKKIISVLKDYWKDSILNSYTLLDAGCSAGLITAFLGTEFKQVVGVDLDELACCSAHSQNHRRNVHFAVSDALSLPFANATFDVVVCTHIYEHVPDPQRLLDEIYRVLKYKGVCYFSAANRIRIFEPHYKLPFLSLLPRPLAHIYLRVARGKSFYYEKMMMPWELKKVVRRFEVVDYTKKVISEPRKYFIDELIPGGILGRFAMLILKRISWLSPTFIWILKKI